MMIEQISKRNRGGEERRDRDGRRVGRVGVWARRKKACPFNAMGRMLDEQQRQNGTPAQRFCVKKI
jgi:hypothetical protein